MKRILKSDLQRKAKELGITEEEATDRAVTYWLDSFTPTKAITLDDVARVAGISKMACSYALNRDAGKVSEETRLKVRRVAKKLGYVPSQSGLALANAVALRMASTHYSVLEAAKILNISPVVVTNRIRRKELPAEKVGRAWWIPRQAIS